MTLSSPSLSSALDDPINSRILAVSEDRIQGFHPQPFSQIALQADLPLPLVLDRIRAMLLAGTIRRVRQTLMANNLAAGALIAWQIDTDKLNSAFDYLFQQDPFSGHVVIRTADPTTPGSTYRLWTTLKVPQGFSLQKHAQFLCQKTGADCFRLMPAQKLFALGVGHIRRRTINPGDKSPDLARVIDIQEIRLSDLQWQVLTALKRELSPDEISDSLWPQRAAQASIPFDQFCQIAQSLADQGIIGRFSTFLEHVKPLSDGQRVTRFNALFHWAVPPGLELQAGREVGRFEILTHAYWRQGGPEFNHVNIMAVAHGTDQNLLLQHKAAIDSHLAQSSIPVSYTNVFWGGRSEIKPSEIAPQEYISWCLSQNIDPQSMRENP